MHLVVSVPTSVCATPITLKFGAKDEHYQSCVSVCNQGAFADNIVNAVNQLLILVQNLKKKFSGNSK